MQLKVTCPACGTNGVLPDAQPGEAVACPHCKSVFVTSRAQDGEFPGSTAADVLGIWLGPGETLTDLTVPVTSTHTPTPPEQSPRPPIQDRPPGGGFTADSAKDEVARLNQYVAREFDKLKLTRHQLVELQSKAEAAAYERQTELARRDAELNARRATLDLREAELAAAATALRLRESEVRRTAAVLADREAAALELEAKRRTLGAEVADLGRLASELRPVVERLQVRRDETEAARADLEARQAALDRRMIEVGRTELALQARLDELDQLERELRSELEARELELERQRVMLNEEVKAARHVPVDAPTPPPAVWADPAPQWLSNQPPSDEAGRGSVSFAELPTGDGAGERD